MQGAEFSLLSWGIPPSPPSDIVCYSVSPEPQAQPTVGSLYTVALESILQSKMLVFMLLFGVEKWFSLLFVCSGNVMNWIYNFQSKFSLLRVFLQLRNVLLFYTRRRNGNFTFETSQNTAILTFGKHHYVKILHCMVNKVHLSIFLKPQSLNFTT